VDSLSSNTRQFFVLVSCAPPLSKKYSNYSKQNINRAAQKIPTC
jgi:hypothetical protein